MQYQFAETTFVYDSPQMHLLYETIQQAAQHDSTVLVSGETGTGKGVVGRMVHYLSNRRQAPLVNISCPALADSLVESELFGHEKGAFTGAEFTKPGKFEMADKGTLLLDEVSEVNLNFQCKLLRVLEEKSFERVGGNITKKVDVRFVATSNRNLAELVRRGGFREDLYYRLNIVPIHIPPLREHKDDIIPLIHYYLTYRFPAVRRNKEIHKDTFGLMLEYNWPGNIRELFNIVERMMTVIKGDTILPGHIAGWLTGSESSFEEQSSGAVKTIDEVERDAIRRALVVCGGNRQRTAEALNMAERTLRYKIDRYGLAQKSS